MFAYLRREHALSAQQLLGGERAQQQYIAASRIQAVARGASARTRVAGASYWHDIDWKLFSSSNVRFLMSECIHGRQLLT
jgi:hypothetical protein